jgi:hypothetical protein
MGLDFLDKTAKQFNRSCRQGFEVLDAEGLFGPDVSPEQRTFLATVLREDAFQEGLEVVLRPREDNNIGVYVNEREVGLAQNPPTVVLESIREAACGMAVGTIESLHPLSGTVDIVLT